MLPFYLVYRALVRAKTSLMRAHAHGALPESSARAWDAFRSYLALAASYSRRERGAIVILNGRSGSGKTTLSQPALAALGAVRVRTDVERKRLHGLSPLAVSERAGAAELYSAGATARTYGQLAQHARTIACAGLTAMVDATFLKRGQRAVFEALARELDVIPKAAVLAELETNPRFARRMLVPEPASGRTRAQRPRSVSVGMPSARTGPRSGAARCGRAQCGSSPQWYIRTAFHGRARAALRGTRQEDSLRTARSTTAC